MFFKEVLYNFVKGSDNVFKEVDSFTKQEIENKMLTYLQDIE